MLTLPTSVRVFVATGPVDGRKSFDGLSIAVANVLEDDPRSGHLYYLFNGRANQVRVLFWDPTGWCPVAKRLARGPFSPARIVGCETPSIEADAAELMLILEGIELRSARRRRRYRLPTSSNLHSLDHRADREPPRSHLVDEGAIEVRNGCDWRIPWGAMSTTRASGWAPRTSTMTARPFAASSRS